ncbi:hypothetical protein GR702_11555 [Novosphingobium sp. FGD1]|uniref:Uncharacterized protein n=1 Tax=Novosphingobium silvae TaxID=2692619 RepID=A0A7X4GIV9_9SPHN|nr:hypothetical protein [Novosphingobium silvae]MYL98399.1 hypothetical protein [Novosphingobium silvae]
MTSTLKSLSKSAITYLGDAAHRRFVAVIAALGTTHLLGWALDADQIALAIEIVIGGVGGAWTGARPEADQ